MSPDQPTPPDGGARRPRGGGSGRFLFIVLALAVVLAVQQFGSRKGPPARERIVGVWYQSGVARDPATRRGFSSDGSAFLERVVPVSTTSANQFQVQSRREGRYEFIGDDTLTVTFGDGVEETWTVQFPNATSIHLGGTGIQGGTFFDPSSVPSYAPTTAR